MIVEDAEYQEASIPIASNLTDHTDRTYVPNESATKTSESSEHVTNNPLEGTDNILLELPAELELYDTEEVPVGEDVPFRYEDPEIGELAEQLLDQQSSDIHN